MQTNIHEIADGVYRLSTCVPDVAPGGFTFNQYLIDADEPFLFHTGPRQMFDLVAPAAAQVIDIERLRWISFGHVESDECGAMNRWLEAAPHSAVTFNGLGCNVSLNDLADRPPVVASDGEPLDIGGHRSSPSRPRTCPTAGRHRWCSTRPPARSSAATCSPRSATDRPSCTTPTSSVPPSPPRTSSRAPASPPARRPTLRRLAALEPRTLALMHGPAFVGDCSATLLELADAYEARVRSAWEQEAAA